METASNEDEERHAIVRAGESNTFKRKYLAVVILLTINLLNYVDRFTIAGVLTKLQTYFKINDQESGLIQTMFIVFYMLCAPICGYLGDRYNRKLIMTAGLSFWIISVFLSTTVGPNSFKLFLFLRGLVGVGEASYSTVAPTIIADLFKGKSRSLVLMTFYFAVPVGSGLGYVSGSYFSLWTGSWQGGVRFTPILGVICLAAMQFLLDEPARGLVDHAELQSNSLREDLQYLKSIPTYRMICCGFTCVVFGVGALSWWTPNFIGYAFALQKGVSPQPADMASVSLIFGLITCMAGIVGVIMGTYISTLWKEGKLCFHPNICAEAFVCGIGSITAVPFLFSCLLIARHSITTAWFLLFFSITAMCLNWAINMDILMSVVVANRRASATAIQTLLSHLFGDAASPYVIGAVSDAIRKGDTSYPGRYFALQTSLFIPLFLLIISGGFYLWATFYMVDDMRNALQLQHTLGPVPVPTSTTRITMDAEEEITLSDVKRYVNFLIVRIDHIMLDTPSILINHLSTRGELFGFKLAYKVPRAAKSNSQLDREILATGDYSSLGSSEVNEIRFKHKKVFPVELDEELIDTWERATLQISLNAVTSGSKTSSSRSSKHIARAFIPLDELLSPPFQISRDCTIVGNNFTGRISVSIELGSRNTRISESLASMRRTALNSTFSLLEEKPAHRTRSRSHSRCRSHSLESENRNEQTKDKLLFTCASLSDKDNNNHNFNDYPIRNVLSPRAFAETNVPFSSKNNVTTASESSSSANMRSGALFLELTAHSATNLPLVQDVRGNWVPPMAFIQMLGRDEQVVSTIASASCNPVWNWTGKFVISSERGNLLIKLFHKMGDKVCALGCVTLASPLRNFTNKEFEISLFWGTITTTSTITLSLIVHSPIYEPSGHYTGTHRDVPSRSTYDSNFTRNEENFSPIEERNVEYRHPFNPSGSIISPRQRQASTEALRNKLQEDVEDLLNVMNNLGKR